MPKKGPKGKKGKAAAAVDESVEVAPEPEPVSEEPWTCLECEQENEFTDEACIACDEPRPKAAEPEAVDPYAGFKVGTRWMRPTRSPVWRAAAAGLLRPPPGHRCSALALVLTLAVLLQV
jgi:hypothetical protein